MSPCRGQSPSAARAPAGRMDTSTGYVDRVRVNVRSKDRDQTASKSAAEYVYYPRDVTLTDVLAVRLVEWSVDLARIGAWIGRNPTFPPLSFGSREGYPVREGRTNSCYDLRVWDPDTGDSSSVVVDMDNWDEEGRTYTNVVARTPNDIILAFKEVLEGEFDRQTDGGDALNGSTVAFFIGMGPTGVFEMTCRRKSGGAPLHCGFLFGTGVNRANSGPEVLGFNRDEDVQSSTDVQISSFTETVGGEEVPVEGYVLTAPRPVNHLPFQWLEVAVAQVQDQIPVVGRIHLERPNDRFSHARQQTADEDRRLFGGTGLLERPLKRLDALSVKITLCPGGYDFPEVSEHEFAFEFLRVKRGQPRPTWMHQMLVF